jgi:hypothetical protein
MKIDELKRLNDLQDQIESKESEIRTVNNILAGSKHNLHVYYATKGGGSDTDSLYVDTNYSKELIEYILGVKKAELNRLQLAFDRIKIINQ